MLGRDAGIGMYDPLFILLIQPLLFHLESNLPDSWTEIVKVSETNLAVITL